MKQAVNVKNTGLRGVTVADTKISFINGEEGILIYRGYRIEDLAERSSFPEVAYLLLNGTLPDGRALGEFDDRLREARDLPPHVTEVLRRCSRNAAPMDVLQAAVPLLASADPDAGARTREKAYASAVRLISRLPALVAAWHRVRQGLEPVPPDPGLAHAADFLARLLGDPPDEETARDLDTGLILHADHTFNASTFACREVASTGAHMYAALAAAVGALSGRLHGGANARVMRMLLELRNEPDIEGWVRGVLQRGGRIMGMGHAVYRTEDPRARFLRAMAEHMAARTGQKEWIDLARRVEKAALEAFEEAGRTEIRPNLDFYSAPVYHMMGIPTDLMTPVFAASRVSGWCAHYLEEAFAEAQEKPALYRPKAEYVGRYCGLIGCDYEPLEGRVRES